MDGVALLSALPDRSAAVVFFDPQHRDVLDRQAYGNEGERQIGRAELPQMTGPKIRTFMAEIERVLRRSGHLFLWVDKYLAARGRWAKWLPDATGLKEVDFIHWNKGRDGMGRRARCRSEYLLVIQKPPVRAEGCWTDHRIPDSWLEYADAESHVHAKPLALTRRLIAATTKRDDLVVDPAAGGYGVLEVCRDLGREFVGCDLK